MNKKIVKRIGIATLGVCVLLLVALLFIGNYMVEYSLTVHGGGGNREVTLEVKEYDEELQQIILDNEKKQEKLNKSFESRVKEQAVHITSEDGLKLNAAYFEQSSSHKWAIVIHGYNCDHSNMERYSQHYYDAGYQVLAPDLRACGESEGTYYGMGWLDRKDILGWMDWIIKKDPDAEIVVHGNSMGGATVMMVSGEKTPDNVKVFVEDCGYSCVWDIFASEMQLRFGLPEFPIMHVSSLVSSVKVGYDFSEASAVEQVKKCKKPMLFIHGSEDDFVPFSMLEEVYEAKPGNNKKKLVVEGAKHNRSSYVLGEAYWNEVFSFIDTYSCTD